MLKLNMVAVIFSVSHLNDIVRCSVWYFQAVIWVTRRLSGL